MTTSSPTAIASAKKIMCCEHYRLALDIVVFAFDEGRCRLRMLFVDRSLEAFWTQAARLADWR